MADEGYEIDDETKARALARSLLADIALHNREDLRAGRDMRAVFEEARMLYAAKVVKGLDRVFDEELAAFVVRDEARPNPPSETREEKRAILRVAATAAFAVALFAFMWATTRTDGEGVVAISIPGSATLDVQRGDKLHFEADHDVYFAADGAQDVPDGCVLDVMLEQDGRELARSHCDLFHTSGTDVIEDGENEEIGEDGLTHLEVFDVHLACGFKVAQSGRIKLVLTSNLATCVPRRGRSTVHVFRARGH